MNNNSQRNLVERIFITKQAMLDAEAAILSSEHLRRYGAIRRFCYGQTLDLACGCGYGSYLLSANPDVERVVAVDMSSESIEWAKKEFSSPKIEYCQSTIENIQGQYDTLVCLETIEHIKDINFIPNLVERCKIDNVIISFPDKKTTHYNPYHFHDLVKQDVIDLFPKYLPYHSIRFVDSTSVLLMRTPINAPPNIFRNLRDL